MRKADAGRADSLTRPIAAVAGIALALLAACAKPPPPRVTPSPLPTEPLVVLLPDAEGKTGAVVVTRGAGEQVLDAPYAAAGVGGDGRVQVSRATPDEVRRVWSDT